MTDTIFGTDGIRAQVGKFPFLAPLLQALGQSIAVWAIQKYNKVPRLLLGHDTRISCDFVKSALKSGLLLHPIQLFDGHVLTSPAVCKIITQKEFDCGIIISASHNPYQDNGIKLIDSVHGKLSLHDELEITHIFKTISAHIDYTHLGLETPWNEAESCYRKTVEKYFNANFLRGKKIVLDCANGAAFHSAPKIFQDFGATTFIINNIPNGYNINNQCGALHPQSLQRAVVEHNADIGFAFDGDADRVIVVNHQGIIKDGDDILALLLHHPLYQKTEHIVGTIMSNQGLHHYLNAQSKILLRTPVGDKYIAALLAEKGLLLGGEPSGHIIMRDYLPTGDGIFTALRILETLLITNNWAMETFNKFPQIIINVPIAYKKDLTTTPYAQLIHTSERALIQGRLVIRYSGTEQLLRIMIEDSDLNHARFVANELAQQLSQALN